MTIYYCLKCQYFLLTGNGKIEMVYTPEGGAENRMEVFNFKDGGGVAMTMYNTDEVSTLKSGLYAHELICSPCL